MFTYVVLFCLLCGGCRNIFQNDDSAAESSSDTRLSVSKVNWIIDYKLANDTEVFATRLWMEKAQAGMFTSSAGPALNVVVQSSSFIEFKSYLEFKIQLLCSTPDSEIKLQIVIKGRRNLGSMGKTIDKVTDQIAESVRNAIGSDYGSRSHMVRMRNLRKIVDRKMIDGKISNSEDLIVESEKKKIERNEL